MSDPDALPCRVQVHTTLEIEPISTAVKSKMLPALLLGLNPEAVREGAARVLNPALYLSRVALRENDIPRR